MNGQSLEIGLTRMIDAMHLSFFLSNLLASNYLSNKQNSIGSKLKRNQLEPLLVNPTWPSDIGYI